MNELDYKKFYKEVIIEGKVFVSIRRNQIPDDILLKLSGCEDYKDGWGNFIYSSNTLLRKNLHFPLSEGNNTAEDIQKTKNADWVMIRI